MYYVCCTLELTPGEYLCALSYCMLEQMPSATCSKKRRHREGIDDNTDGGSKRGQATDIKKIGASKNEDEDGGEDEGSDSQEEGPWRNVEISSAALREACLVATPQPAASAEEEGDPPVDRCITASAREKSRRDKQQRRARALETLWKRLKVRVYASVYLRSLHHTT